MLTSESAKRAFDVWVEAEDMTAKHFKDFVCASLKVVEIWDRLMQKKFEERRKS